MSEASRQACSELCQHRDILAEAIVARQYARQPELWKPYSDRGRAMAVRDVLHHLDYLAHATLVEEQSLFLDYTGWLKVLFLYRSLPDSGLRCTLECCGEVISETLTQESVSCIQPYIRAARDYLPHAPLTVEPFIAKDEPYADLARKYLATLLEGSRSQAGYLIGEAIAGGATVEDMYLYVFQPCQWEIGRLWQMNKISVADEHFCTAATQLIMSQLYGHIFSGRSHDLRMVSACVGDELHEIGARMVADLFETHGWDTVYLGANVPVEGIISAIMKHSPNVLAVSVTLVSHLGTAKDMIARIREAGSGDDLKIMVGGYPFRIAPGLSKQIGADATALDGRQAVDTANSIVSTG